MPEVLWFQGLYPVDTLVKSNPRLVTSRDGTELVLSSAAPGDQGDYTCVARNTEGRIHHTAVLSVTCKQTRIFHIDACSYS